MKINGHGAQLCKEPMKRWVVKVEDHPRAVEVSPWVNYQGYLYKGQGGEHFIVTNDPKDMDRWEQLVKATKVEDPPYGDLKELKLCNSIKVCHMKVGDPNIALYVKESGESLSFYYARKPTPNTIEIEKVLYAYLEGMFKMKLKFVFLDNLQITYEPMEQRIAPGMTWQGLSDLELAPKTASSIGGEHVSHRREESRGVPIIEMPPTTSGEALSSRSHRRSEGVCQVHHLCLKLECTQLLI